jgi:soluble lytic murein transglycosylase-like protein
VQASALALGAAIVLLPSPVGHPVRPRQVAPPSIPRPLDPLAAHVLEQMPSLGVKSASDLAIAVRSESAAAGLDPVLVMAVIEVESGWQPAAVSERGARGLMQLRRLAIETEERAAGLAPGDVLDPIHNVRMGVRYLARMVATFEDVDLGLLAYNVGPTRALSLLVAVEDIPEAYRSYARKVRREERRIRSELMREPVIVANAAG